MDGNNFQGINKAKEKLGENLMTLANLLLVLFLFNTYMQQVEYSLTVVLLSVYGIINLYALGFNLIKKANEE
jgi:hypothetical protein